MSESGDLQMPPQLIVKLTPAEVEALSHPYRRQILRALARQVTKLSPGDVAESGLLPCSLSCAGYHMCVLAQAGLLEEERPGGPHNTPQRYFSARIGDSGALSGFLQRTVTADERQIAEQDS